MSASNTIRIQVKGEWFDEGVQYVPTECEKCRKIVTLKRDNEHSNRYTGVCKKCGLKFEAKRHGT